MILVINPNPALDRVAVVRFRPKETLRPVRFSTWAGGSGIHAGYVARLLGADVLALAFAGGHTGALLRDRLAVQGVPAELIAVAGETRQTFSLLDVAGGNLCDVVEAGPAVDAAAVRSFERAARARIPAADLVVISGSLPAGCPFDLAARLVEVARAAGIPCVADVAGDVLRATLGARPWLVKPSRAEVAEVLGVGADSIDTRAALDVARRWLAQGVEHVCVSLDAQGLLWVSATGVRRLRPPAVAAYNSIGCGDTLVGALAATYARTRDLDRAMRTGVAAASANLCHDAPGYCTPEEVAALVGAVEVDVLEGPRWLPDCGQGARRPDPGRRSVRQGTEEVVGG